MLRNKLLNNNRSQITIFVIISLIVVVFIALIYAYLNRDKVALNPIDDPQAYIEQCTRVSLEKAEKLLIESNLYPNLSNNYMVYMNQKVPYLCVSSQFYKPCVNQEPMLLEKLRRDIENRTKKEVERCFSDLVKQMKNKGYDVKEGKLDYHIVLTEDRIVANIEKQIIFNRIEENRVIEKWSSELPSSIYDLANTARTIVNFESTLCEFNNMGWMSFFPDINIKRFVTSDSTRVYTLNKTITGKTIKFAVKTCQLPAGI